MFPKATFAPGHAWLLAAALLAWPMAALRAQDSIPPLVRGLSAAQFSQSERNIPGLGKVAGISPFKDARYVRYMAGDDSAWAAKTIDERPWAKKGDTDSLERLNAPVYWARFHFSVDPSLNGSDLMLHLVSPGDLELWMDGRPLLRSSMPMADLPEEASGTDTPASILEFSLGKVSTGAPHVLAIRMARSPQGGALSELKAVIHQTGSQATIHRSVLHYGIFIGINLLMLVMALIYWRLSRQEKVWPWFALLTGINAFIAFTEMLRDVAMGLPAGTVRILKSAGTLSMLLPLVFSVVLLLLLINKLDRKRIMLYTGAAILTCAALAGLLKIFADLDGFPPPATIVTIILLMAVLGAGYVWLAVDALRFGWQALRSTGYIRWMGAGIVLSVLAPVLKVLPRVFLALVLQTDASFPAWYDTATEYLSYIAIPLAIITALAIRAAIQHRLLSRQRDELDLEVKERTAELGTEKERSDALLLNILPAEVAEELKANGSAQAKHFDRATVLFTDFKGFTAMSAQMQPTELLAELNACFKAFDGIIEKHGVEKIKTIGDAYMCANGLPDPRNASTSDVVLAALEMQEFMEGRHAERTALGHPAFRMRAGIHTGQVVAGIVGVKKFQYDIWGDTVNTAARMESHGEAGRVNISAEVFAAIKDAPEGGAPPTGDAPSKGDAHPATMASFRFIPRGPVEVKGKGRLEMWFVEGT